MPSLDPQMAAILERFARSEAPPYEEMSPQAARALAAELGLYWNEDPLPMTVEEVALGGIPGQLYRPPGAAAPTPCLIYVHGGGWVICGPVTHDNICRQLVSAGGFAVLSLDYRLAPEHPFPAALEDCLAAVRGLRRDGASLGLDPERLVLGGDSAGANLSLATCLRLRDAGEAPADAAVLVYGVFSADHDSPSHLAFGDGRYILSTAEMQWFWAHYVADPARRGDPLASPLHADLRGLPPLYVAAAEFDPLRDDSERLARRLVEAGIDVDYRLWRGMTHACLGYGRDLDAARRFIQEIAGFAARHLHR